MDNNCQEAKPHQIEKVPQRRAVLHLASHIPVKGGDARGLPESTGDRLARWEKAKWGPTFGTE